MSVLGNPVFELDLRAAVQLLFPFPGIMANGEQTERNLWKGKTFLGRPWQTLTPISWPSLAARESVDTSGHFSPYSSK